MGNLVEVAPDFAQMVQEGDSYMLDRGERIIGSIRTQTHEKTRDMRTFIFGRISSDQLLLLRRAADHNPFRFPRVAHAASRVQRAASLVRVSEGENPLQQEVQKDGIRLVGSRGKALASAVVVTTASLAVVD